MRGHTPCGEVGLILFRHDAGAEDVHIVVHTREHGHQLQRGQETLCIVEGKVVQHAPRQQVRLYVHQVIWVRHQQLISLIHLLVVLLGQGVVICDLLLADADVGGGSRGLAPAPTGTKGLGIHLRLQPACHFLICLRQGISARIPTALLGCLWLWVSDADTVGHGAAHVGALGHLGCHGFPKGSATVIGCIACNGCASGHGLKLGEHKFGVHQEGLAHAAVAFGHLSACKLGNHLLVAGLEVASHIRAQRQVHLVADVQLLLQLTKQLAVRCGGAHALIQRTGSLEHHLRPRLGVSHTPLLQRTKLILLHTPSTLALLAGVGSFLRSTSFQRGADDACQEGGLRQQQGAL
mmetsp:Transcript_23761/g.65310  ORF Transcript_23761/g.65310 Transcript_23761/m.65310 type:complete len:350 (-) Transcript_23761:553-1602(-)